MPKPQSLRTMLLQKQSSGEIDKSIPIPTTRMLGHFIKTKLDGEKMSNFTFNDLLNWSKDKLCLDASALASITDGNELLVLKQPRQIMFTTTDDEGNQTENPGLCMIVSTKNILLAVKSSAFTNDGDTLPLVCKLDATFKLCNNGWLLSPVCTESAIYKKPVNCAKGLKVTGHSHPALPITFMIHSTENKEAFQEAINVTMNLPSTYFGYSDGVILDFPWFVSDNSRSAQNAATEELDDVIILNCQDHLLRKYDHDCNQSNKIQKRDLVPVIESILRAMAHSPTTPIQQLIFDVLEKYCADVFTERRWLISFKKYYMGDINRNWFDTASGMVRVRHVWIYCSRLLLHALTSSHINCC